MSIKHFPFKAVIALIFFGLCIGVGIAYWQESAGRKIASLEEAQAFPAPKLNLWGHSPYGKMNQSIDVRLEALGGIPDNDEQELRLIAHVTLHRPIDQELSYQWVLPPGAELVSGELEDVWPGIQPGQTVSTEISLLGVSKEGLVKSVTLHVSGISQSVKYANSGSFTTSPRQLDESHEELALKKKSEIGKIKE